MIIIVFITISSPKSSYASRLPSFLIFVHAFVSLHKTLPLFHLSMPMCLYLLPRAFQIND